MPPSKPFNFFRYHFFIQRVFYDWFAFIDILQKEGKITRIRFDKILLSKIRKTLERLISSGLAQCNKIYMYIVATSIREML